MSLYCMACVSQGWTEHCPLDGDSMQVAVSGRIKWDFSSLVTDLTLDANLCRKHMVSGPKTHVSTAMGVNT